MNTGLEEFRSEPKFSDDSEFQHITEVSDPLWADRSIFQGTNSSLGQEAKNYENLPSLWVLFHTLTQPTLLGQQLFLPWIGTMLSL